jgi:hypothetical protein
VKVTAAKEKAYAPGSYVIRMIKCNLYDESFSSIGFAAGPFLVVGSLPQEGRILVISSCGKLGHTLQYPDDVVILPPAQVPT